MSANKPTSIFQEKLSQEKLNELKKIQTEKAAELLWDGKSPQEVAEKLGISVKELGAMLIESGLSPKETAEIMGITSRELSLLLAEGNAAKSRAAAVKQSSPAETQKKVTRPPAVVKKDPKPVEDPKSAEDPKPTEDPKPAADCEENELKDRIVFYAFLECAKTLDRLNKPDLWRRYLIAIDSWVQKMLPEIEQTPEMVLNWATLALATARKKVDPNAK